MLRILLVLILLLPASLGGQTRVQTSQVEAMLIPASRSFQPGVPLGVAVHLSIAPGWHIYWKNPGESGLPTTVRWRGPAGFRAGALQWPNPERKELSGLTVYVYEGEVVLLSEIHPPAELRPGEAAEITALVGWGVCREVCIPQEVRLSFSLPVRNETPRPDRR